VTPTARAIQERFNRIRKIIGVGGTSAGRRAPTTPRRGRARAPRTPTAAAASRKRKGQKSVSDSSDTEENISAGEYGPSPTKVAKTSASDDGIVESPVSGRQAGPRAGVPVLGSPIKLKSKYPLNSFRVAPVTHIFQKINEMLTMRRTQHALHP
jgi:hypothetical protein